MHDKAELTTRRLRLRRWQPADAEPFAILNADLRTVQYVPGPLSRADSDAFLDRIEAHFRAEGFGLWALEVPGVTPFAGFVGLNVPRFAAHFVPCVEIGWRLAPDYWGRGYATEGARAALGFGFDRLQLDQIVSFTVPQNRASRLVMERIGMTRDSADDFDHPSFPDGDPLQRHVLYRITREKVLPSP